MFRDFIIKDMLKQFLLKENLKQLGSFFFNLFYILKSHVIIYQLICLDQKKYIIHTYM